MRKEVFFYSKLLKTQKGADMLLLLLLIQTIAAPTPGLLFNTVFTETSRPIFGSLCRDQDSLHLLLENKTLVSWTGGAKHHRVMDSSVYGIICMPSGEVVPLVAKGEDTEMKGNTVKGRFYWHAWDRKSLFGNKSEWYAVLGSALVKSSVNNKVRELQGSVYGCSISFRRVTVECNSDPHSALTFISGVHRYGSSPIRIYSAIEGSPSYIISGQETVSETILKSNLPKDSTEIRIYSNAMGKIYSSYLHNGAYRVAYVSDWPGPSSSSDGSELS